MRMGHFNNLWKCVFVGAMVIISLSEPCVAASDDLDDLDNDFPPSSNNDDDILLNMGGEEDKHHLIVLTHGLHGTPASMEDVLQKLIASHGPCHSPSWVNDPDASFAISHGVYLCPQKDTVLYNSHANTGPNGRLDSIPITSRGIEHGGKKLFNAIKELKEKIPVITDISMVGLSLGGLYSRFAVGLLHYQYGELIRFRNFVTLACPHLGVRRHINWVYEAAVEAGLLGRTGTEITLKDSHEPDELPLLVNMTRPNGIFWKGLNRFYKLVSIANSDTDDKVPFWSSSLLEPVVDVFEKPCSENNSARSKNNELHAWHKFPDTDFEVHWCFKCENSTKYPYIVGSSFTAITNPGARSEFNCQYINGHANETDHSWGKVLQSAWKDVDPYPLQQERFMATNLRTLRTRWTIVHVKFDTFGGFFLNHMRIANRPAVLTRNIGDGVTSAVAHHISS